MGEIDPTPFPTVAPTNDPTTLAPTKNPITDSPTPNPTEKCINKFTNGKRCNSSGTVFQNVNLSESNQFQQCVDLCQNWVSTTPEIGTPCCEYRITDKGPDMCLFV